MDMGLIGGKATEVDQEVHRNLAQEQGVNMDPL